MTNNGRDTILNRLREAKRPFPQNKPVPSHQPMTKVDSPELAALQARFVQEAEALQSIVHQPESHAEALEIIFSILADDRHVLSWSFDHIPLPELALSLQQKEIAAVKGNDPTVRVGITGANAALATTGSLVMMSGNGRFRATSLLPQCHIAIITAEQILPDLESWFMQQRNTDALNQFKQASNVVLVSGASRTGDIAMELVMGVHGPGELHIIILTPAQRGN